MLFIQDTEGRKKSIGVAQNFLKLVARKCPVKALTNVQAGNENNSSEIDFPTPTNSAEINQR